MNKKELFYQVGTRLVRGVEVRSHQGPTFDGCVEFRDAYAMQALLHEYKILAVISMRYLKGQLQEFWDEEFKMKTYFKPLTSASLHQTLDYFLMINGKKSTM